MSGLSNRDRIIKYLQQSGGYVSAQDVSRAINMRSGKTAGQILGQLYDEGLLEYKARQSKLGKNLWKLKEGVQA